MRTFNLLTVLAILVGAMTFKAVGQEPGEKPSPRVSLNYVQMGNDSHMVSLKAIVKKGRERLPASGMLVNLYLNEITKGGMMGSMVTDEDGKCVFPLVNKFEQARDTVDSFLFIARVINDPQYEDEVKELLIQKALLEFEEFKDDSLKSFVVRLSIPSDSGRIGVPEEQVQVFIKRMYSLLPIGGDYLFTDEDGRINVDFPEDIPGDSTGNVTLVVRVPDHGDFGTLQEQHAIDWGVPVTPSDLLGKRALWASGANAPLFLMISIISMIVGIWGVIIYIGIQIVRMHKLGVKASSILHSQTPQL